jgi:hypothetical protein
MSSQPENNFIKSIHRLLPRELHHEKMHNMYRGGTPDVWYSGIAGDLWIEYKYMKTVPVRKVIDPCNSDELLSVLQQNWLRDRYGEGRSIGVIIGCPSGGVIFTGLEWEKELPAHDFIQQLQDKKAIAQCIVETTTGVNHANSLEKGNLPTTRKVPARDRHTSDMYNADGQSRRTQSRTGGTQR